ncbi:MAG: DUF937 domain-containing protein [Pirellulaceae bacterium]|nr:DUF937 domain-containing protein [Planctomycetales bacterium]
MSSLLDLIGDQLTGSATQQISQQLGLDETQTKTAIAAALPTLLEAVGRQAATPDGAQGLHQALAKDHDGSLLDNVAGFFQGGGGGRAGLGEGILGHILGSKRQRVEQGVGQMAGVDAATSGKLLSMLAPIVMGALGKQQRQQGFGVDQLTDFIGKQRQSVATGDPQSAGIFQKLLDQDGDGDFDVSDMMRLGSSFIGRMFKK